MREKVKEALDVAFDFGNALENRSVFFEFRSPCNVSITIFKEPIHDITDSFNAFGDDTDVLDIAIDYMKRLIEEEKNGQTQ